MEPPKNGSLPRHELLVTTLANSTQTIYTLRVQHTISGFSPEPSRCRINTTIALPKGYKGASLAK